MRSSSRMVTNVQVVGAALALALGSFALAGCGGSNSGDDAAAPGDVASVSEEEEPAETVQARRDRLREEQIERTNHWLETVYANSSVQEEDSWVNPGEKSLSKYTHKVEYERDEAGNIIKSTTTGVSESDSYSSNDKTVKEYELDEKGWPVKATVTKTSVYDSLGFVEEEVVNEDGETETVRRHEEQADHHEESGPEESTIEYSYEYDDEGRVIKATSSDNDEGSVEFTYRDDGTVASVKNTESYQSYSMESDSSVTITYSSESVFNEKDVSVASTTTETSADGSSKVTMHEYDDDGNSVKSVTTETKADGTKGEYSFTYESEKDADGNVTKTTCTATGNGNGEYKRYQSFGSGYYRETFDADGKINVAKVSYDENYEEVAGEEKTYDGPYSVTENTYNEYGDLVKKVVTYYDGTVETDEYERRDDGQPSKWSLTNAEGTTRTTTFIYDENGNQIESTSENGDGSTNSNTRTFAYVENPSDYQLHRRYMWW